MIKKFVIKCGITPIETTKPKEDTPSKSEPKVEKEPEPEIKPDPPKETVTEEPETPAEEFENLVDNPQNPFTGKKIESINKNDGLEIFFSTEYNVNTNNGNRFKPGPWFKVRDNVLDKNNWTYLGEY